MLSLLIGLAMAQDYNALLPNLKNGKTLFKLTPAQLSEALTQTTRMYDLVFFVMKNKSPNSFTKELVF